MSRDGTEGPEGPSVHSPNFVVELALGHEDVGLAAIARGAEVQLATSGFDGLVRIWDLETGNMVLEFASDLGTPVVKFSPNARQILYPHGLSIRRMPADPTELRTLAGELLTRDFSPDECVLYAPSERCEDVATGS